LDEHQGNDSGKKKSQMSCTVGIYLYIIVVIEMQKRSVVAVGYEWGMG
jgi:hypothetical protein